VEEAPPDDLSEAEEETGPLRRCIVTGDRIEQERMIRFVIDPDRMVVPDVGSVLPGRGLWLTAERGIVETAIKKRAFDRAARQSVKLPDNLVERVETLLLHRCRDTIGLARRAGIAVAGYEKVREALKSGPVGALLAASDGAVGGREKILALARHAGEITAMTALELGQAFGRDHVVHAMLTPGSLAARLKVDARRLSGFRVSHVTDQNRNHGVPDRQAEDGV